MTEYTSKLPNAIITGASSGIGEAFAYLLAGEGYRPVLIARRQAELQRVAGAIADTYNVDALVVPKDLSTAGAAKELQAELDDRGVYPDLLVNNAGFGLMGKAALLDHDEQIEMINLNVRTLTELSLRYGDVMRQNGRGGIINVTSVAGTLPGPNMAVYYATKAYILSFSEALSVELRSSGVQVTAVLPGVTRTGFHRRAGMGGLAFGTDVVADVRTAGGLSRVSRLQQGPACRDNRPCSTYLPPGARDLCRMRSYFQ